jgi:hypothetical protein
MRYELPFAMSFLIAAAGLVWLSQNYRHLLRLTGKPAKRRMPRRESQVRSIARAAACAASPTFRPKLAPIEAG